MSKRPKRTKIKLKPDLSDWEVDSWVNHIKECMQPRAEAMRWTKDRSGHAIFDIGDIEVWIDEDGLEEAVRKIAGQILEAFFETDCGVFLTEKGILLEHKAAQYTIPYSEVFAEFPQSKIDKLHCVLSDDLVGMPGDVEETNE